MEAAEKRASTADMVAKKLSDELVALRSLSRESIRAETEVIQLQVGHYVIDGERE